MKFAFTTLGCPNWNLDTIITKAIEYGYDGVDFRGYLGQMDIFQSPEFSNDITHTKNKFREASLEITCFSSSVRLFTTSESELSDYIKELHHYGRLCNEFNTPYIRVFGGKIGATSRHDALQKVINNLQKMLRVAEQYQICLLLETHDDWTKCEDVEAVLNKAESNSLQVLWDIHHPYQTIDESPELTWEKLGKWIKYTHWKDSYRTQNKEQGYQLCLLGEGDLPLSQIYELLQEKEYSGYFTLEWEKVWHPEIEEPEIAFKQYIDYMKALAEESKDK